MHFRNCMTALKNVMIHAPRLHLKIDSTDYYHVAECGGGKHKERCATFKSLPCQNTHQL